MNSLIIVDVQNDFMPGGPLAVPRGDLIIPVINALQNKFDLVIATQDWHPATHKSFASNHPNKKPFEQIKLNGIDQILWPNHCLQGSAGADFHPELDTRAIEAIFRKGMDPNYDSYSAFYDVAHKKNTGLTGYLREKKAERLYFTGLCADICVYYTIQDAIKEGFKAILIEDASCPLDKHHYQRLRATLLQQGVEIITSKALDAGDY